MKILIFIIFISLCLSKMNNTIILIGGIGGNILYSSNSNIERIWVVYWNQDDKAKRFYPNSGYDILTSYENCGLTSIYNLDPELIFDMYTAYFSHIIDYFINIGYTPCVDLFGLPYVWTNSITNKTILFMLNELLISNNNNIIISHSMGGLIVNEYIKQFTDKYIHKWISISSPFQGSTLAITSFIQGYNLGNTRLSLDIAKNLSLQSYSTYELLPQLKLNPQPHIYLKYKDNITKLNYSDYISNLNYNFHKERVYERNCINYNITPIF